MLISRGETRVDRSRAVSAAIHYRFHFARNAAGFARALAPLSPRERKREILISFTVIGTARLDPAGRQANPANGDY